MKMRAIWLIDGLGPGGAERVTLSIMAYLAKEDFDLRVGVLHNKQGNPIAQEIEQLGIPVDLVNVPNLRHPLNVPHILKYLHSHQPQLIHTQLEFADTLGNFSAKILGLPSISTLHTLDDPPKGTSTYWRYQLKWASLRYFCDRIITVSDSVRQHHIHVGKLPEKKVMTIYNGIDMSLYAGNEYAVTENTRKSLGIPEKNNVLLSIAVLRELKGIQYMIGALPKILKAVPNLTYLIVGDGDYAATLKQLVKHNGLENHVIFTGQRNDIPELLAIGDIFILPTIKDALPTVLMEAMAAKKPVISCKVGGVPEIIDQRINGLLVPPADSQQLAEACLELLLDKQKANELAIAGFETAKRKFNILNQVQAIKELYLEVIGQYGKL